MMKQSLYGLKFSGGVALKQILSYLKEQATYQKSAMTVIVQTAQAFKTENTKVTYGSVLASAGDKLSLYNGGVKIGAGISYVKISAVLSCGSGLVAGDNFYLYVQRNDTLVYTGAWFKAGQGVTAGTITSPPVVFPVTEGDVIYIYAKNSIGARGTIPVGVINSLTVEEL